MTTHTSHARKGTTRSGSSRDNDVLLHVGFVHHEVCHREVGLPLSLCVGEWDAGLAVRIRREVLASSRSVAAVFTGVVDL